MIRLYGRTDLEDFFKLSGVLEYSKLPHTPYVVFREKGNDVEIEIAESTKRLLELPDDTKVMCQWRGQWRSDFFQFNVGDVRKALKNKEVESAKLGG